MAASMRLFNLPAFSKVTRFISVTNVVTTKRCNYSTQGAVSDPEESLYPPIPPPKDSKLELIRLETEPLIAAETPAEMIYALNKKYTWNFQINPITYHNGFTQFYRHITKTEVVEGLPDKMKTWAEGESVTNHTKNLSNFVQDVIRNDVAIAYRHKMYDMRREHEVGRHMCKNLMSNLVAYLSSSSEHLQDADVDYDVEMKSFWQRGSQKFYQYLGEPLLTIRTNNPLEKMVEADAEVCHGDVPDFPYKPHTISVFQKCYNAACFPGFKHGGGHLNAHTQMYIPHLNRQKLEEQNLLQEALEGFGVSTSFGWLNALALYQKHCCYLDIPKPMSCQTIMTDGRHFSFYCYQLNTLTLDDLKGGDSDLRNVCWQVVDLPLFSAVENDKVVDFNEEVLRLIVAFLTNPTSASQALVE